MTLKEYEWKTDPDFLDTEMPLEIGPNKSVAQKYDFDDKEVFKGEEKLNYGMYIAKCQRFPEGSLLTITTAGIRKNLEKWEIIKACLFYVIHEKAVEKMNRICPNDFQAVPAKIVPSDKSKEEFCIKDYYALHFLHEIDGVDLGACEFYEEGQAKFDDYSTGKISREDLYKGPHSFWPGDWKKKAYFDDKWEGHYLAKDKLTYSKLWHPRLVKLFAKTYGSFFYAADWRKRPAWMLPMIGYN
jgi:hypothetical protein